MKRNSYTFSIDAYTDFTCVGMPMAQSENILVEVSLSDKEVETIKSLVKESTFDSDAGLMPILESDAPALYDLIDKAAKKAILDRMRQKDAEIIAIYRGEEPDDEELLLQEEDVRDVPYICHIPNL